MIKVKEKNGKQYIYQYDTGREVIITPEEGYTVDSIEYFNNTTDLAPIGIIREVDGVLLSEIPNSFLQSANAIRVYLVTHDADNRQTIEYKDITVIPRVKPADYVLEPDDVLTWYSLDERLKTLEEGGTDGGTTSITVDSALDKTSTNPVQNKAVAEAVEKLSNDKLEKTELPEAVNTALTQAKESGEFDGTDGKSAYEYAKDGGYSGTEEEFTLKMEESTYVVYDAETNTLNICSGGVTLRKIDLNSIGSEKTWKLLRTITIPEDVTTDTSGIEWYLCDAEGFENKVAGIFFDKDEKGETFAVRELFIDMNIAYGKSHNYFGVGEKVLNGAFGLAQYRMTNENLEQWFIKILTFADTGYSEVKAKDTFGYASMRTAQKVINRQDNDITQLYISTYLDNYIAVGSTFKIYGR